MSISTHKLINKRNIINVLGFVSLALTVALHEDLIVSPEYVKYITFGITLIGYITNDTFRVNAINKVLGE